MKKKSPELGGRLSPDKKKSNGSEKWPILTSIGNSRLISPNAAHFLKNVFQIKPLEDFLFGAKLEEQAYTPTSCNIVPSPAFLPYHLLPADNH